MTKTGIDGKKGRYTYTVARSPTKRSNTNIGGTHGAAALMQELWKKLLDSISADGNMHSLV